MLLLEWNIEGVFVINSESFLGLLVWLQERIGKKEERQYFWV